MNSPYFIYENKLWKRNHIANGNHIKSNIIIVSDGLLKLIVELNSFPRFFALLNRARSGVGRYLFGMRNCFLNIILTLQTFNFRKCHAISCKIYVGKEVKRRWHALSLWFYDRHATVKKPIKYFRIIVTVFYDFAGRRRLFGYFLSGRRGNRRRHREILVEVGILRQVNPTGHQVQVALVARYQQATVHAGRFSGVPGQTFSRPGGHIVSGIFASAPLGPVGPHAQLAAH